MTRNSSLKSLRNSSLKSLTRQQILKNHLHREVCSKYTSATTFQNLVDSILPEWAGGVAFKRGKEKEKTQDDCDQVRVCSLEPCACISRVLVAYLRQR